MKRVSGTNSRDIPTFKIWGDGEKQMKEAEKELDQEIRVKIQSLMT